MSALRWISRSRRARSGASATCYLHYHAVMTIVHNICGRHWRWLLLDTVNRSWWSSRLNTTANICRMTMSTHQIIIIYKISYFTDWGRMSTSKIDMNICKWNIIQMIPESDSSDDWISFSPSSSLSSSSSRPSSVEDRFEQFPREPPAPSIPPSLDWEAVPVTDPDPPTEELLLRLTGLWKTENDYWMKNMNRLYLLYILCRDINPWQKSYQNDDIRPGWIEPS